MKRISALPAPANSKNWIGLPYVQKLLQRAQINSSAIWVTNILAPQIYGRPCWARAFYQTPAKPPGPALEPLDTRRQFNRAKDLFSHG